MHIARQAGFCRLDEISRSGHSYFLNLHSLRLFI